MGCGIQFRDAWCCKVLSVGFGWQLWFSVAVLGHGRRASVFVRKGGDGEDISHNSGIVVLCLPEYFGESNLLLTFMLSSDFCTGYRAGCSGIYAVVPGRWWEGLTDKVIMSS